MLMKELFFEKTKTGMHISDILGMFCTDKCRGRETITAQFLSVNLQDLRKHL